jgi:hypothetical protein
MVPVTVAKGDFITTYTLAGRTKSFRVGGIRKVDVEGLARPRAFHDLQAGDLLPGIENFGCENFGYRDAQAQTRQIGRPCVRYLAQRRVKRGKNTVGR